MARRKRKEEEADWVAPEFDEVGYMRQEIQGARAAVATIAWAVVGAIVAFLLFSVSPYLAFFAGIAVGFGLYFILPLFGIQTDAFKRKDWTGHGITYFFSWLAVWIILLNPPFGDFTAPTIQGISVSPYRAGYNGPLACVEPTGGTATITMGFNNDSVYLLFRASDNAGLTSLHVYVTPTLQNAFEAPWTPVSGGNRCLGHTSDVYPAGAYNVTFPNNASSYSISIAATDRAGLQANVTFTVLPR